MTGFPFMVDFNSLGFHTFKNVEAFHRGEDTHSTPVWAFMFQGKRVEPTVLEIS